MTLEASFERLRHAAGGLPEVAESTSYGTPALKVRTKLVARIKDADTLVIYCPIEEKERLMAVDAGTYFETEHYRGWPWLLIRASAIADADLKVRLTQAWRDRAPKTLVAAFDRSSV